jgi:hypothetical protein
VGKVWNWSLSSPAPSADPIFLLSLSRESTIQFYRRSTPFPAKPTTKTISTVQLLSVSGPENGQCSFFFVFGLHWITSTAAAAGLALKQLIQIFLSFFPFLDQMMMRTIVHFRVEPNDLGLLSRLFFRFFLLRSKASFFLQIKI